MKNITRIAAAAIALGITTSTVQAGHKNNTLVTESHRIVDYSDELKQEVVKRFSRTGGFALLSKSATEINYTALNIDRLSHDIRSHSDLKHLKDDLNSLEQYIRKFAGVVDRNRPLIVRDHRTPKNKKVVVTRTPPPRKPDSSKPTPPVRVTDHRGSSPVTYYDHRASARRTPPPRTTQLPDPTQLKRLVSQMNRSLKSMKETVRQIEARLGCDQ